MRIQLRNPGGNFLSGQHAGFQQQRFQPAKPAAIVTVREIANGIYSLDRVSKLIATAKRLSADSHYHGEHRSVPAFDKTNRITRRSHLAKPLLTPEIVNAVRTESPSCRLRGLHHPKNNSHCTTTSSSWSWWAQCPASVIVSTRTSRK